MAAPDYSGITKGITGQFDYARQKAAQTENTALQGQKDALTRRAAQLGGGPSGAFVKAEQTAGDQSAQRLQSANEGINQQQAAALRDVNMTQLGQQYQTSEREAGQNFASGERVAGQTYTSGENTKNRDLQKYGIDTSNTLQTGIALGSIGGKDTVAKTSAAEAAKLGEAGLTGSLNGQDTLAKTTADRQSELATAGLTGSLNGQDTLAATGLNHTIAQDKLENDQNINTNALNAIQALAAANYNGADIKALVLKAFPGAANFINGLGDISRLTVNGPGQGVQPATVAPRPVAGTAPAAPSAAGGSYDPYAYHGESY